MSKAESKADRKLVNFRADVETVNNLELLSTHWGLSQTGTIVRAVSEARAALPLAGIGLTIPDILSQLLASVERLPSTEDVAQTLRQVMAELKSHQSTPTANTVEVVSQALSLRPFALIVSRRGTH